MSKMIQQGTHKADPRFYITVTEKGPLLVYGKPPLSQQFIIPDSQGASWEFRKGENYAMTDPVALCRCGASRNKPYCDGSHVAARWDPRLTAPQERILDGAKTFEGPSLVLTDNEKYCVFARFCDAKGRVWNLVGQSGDPVKRDHTIHEAQMCPNGRLSAWDRETGKPFEPKYEPSLGLVEDPAIKVSGGLWVRGGIPVQREDGTAYEIRNRVVLCRCGMSSNKPFCNGAHAHPTVKFDDGLGR